MRAHEFISEAIPNRPRNLGAYLRSCIAKIARMGADLAAVRETVAKHEQGEKMLATWLRYATGELVFVGDALYTIKSDYAKSGLPLDDLKHSVDAYLTHGPDFLKYVLSALDRFEPIDLAMLQQSLPLALEGARQWGFEPGTPDTDNDPEYVDAVELQKALMRWFDIYDRARDLFADMKVKLGQVADLRAAFYAGRNYRPPHGETETLYHATAFVTEILRDGFAAEKPVDRRGLGNFGEQASISFTHDLEIARNIMRSLKEMWMIAHGQLTGKDLAKWFKSENITNDDLRSLIGDRDPASFKEPEEVGKLYRYWLALTKLRDDPVMTYPEEVIQMLATRKLSDIGVLACEVRLDQSDEYFHGEREFRLPADRVISIKKVL